MSNRRSRRQLLRAAGVAAAGLGVAGCLRLSQSDGTDGNSTATGDTTAPTATPDTSGQATQQPAETRVPDETTRSQNNSQPSGEVTVAGSPLLDSLTTAVTEQLQTDLPGISVTNETTSVVDGFDQFTTGDVPVVAATRAMFDSERTAAEQSFEPLQIQIGTDLLVHVVNLDNDWVSTITTAELTDIWSAGSPAQSWADVRDEFPDRPIDLFGPNRTRGLYTYLSAAVGDSQRRLRTDLETTADRSEIVQAVSGNLVGLGALSYANYVGSSETVRALAVDDGRGAVEPSIDTASAYPHTHPLYLYVNGEAYQTRPEVREFVQAYAQAATALPREFGFAPISNVVAEKNEQVL